MTVLERFADRVAKEPSDAGYVVGKPKSFRAIRRRMLR
jgi:hypothetical protein